MNFQNEIWLALRNDAEPGDGTPGNPFAVNTPGAFATRMDSLPPNSLIRLGTGIFRTRGTIGNGYDMDPAHIWSPKSGQKVIGAGLFSTTLQFVSDLPPNAEPSEHYQPGQRRYMIFSPQYLSGFELSDLTLDCNLQNAPFGPRRDSAPITGSTSGAGLETVTSSASFFNTNGTDMVGATIVFSNNFAARIMSVTSPLEARLSVGQAIDGLTFQIFGVRFSVTAVSLTGENIRVRRVRVINFGTRTPGMFDGLVQPPGPNRTYEGFPLRIEGRTMDTPSFNSVLEQCIIEQPYPSPAREVTFAVGGGAATWVRPPAKLHLEPFGCGLRNCSMNFEFTNPRPGHPIVVDSVRYPAPDPTVVTVTTRFPHRLYVGDYVELVGGGVTALNHRRFRVDSINPRPRGAEREFVIRISPRPTQLPTGAISMFSHPLQTMPVASLARNAAIVTAVTTGNHGRKRGDWIVISGAEQSEYNGTFAVRAGGLTDTQFRYNLGVGETPLSPASGEIWLDRRPNSKVRVASVTRQNDLEGAPVGEFVTWSPHYRKPGEWIIPWDTILTTGPNQRNNSYNNYIEIIAVIDRVTFRCRLPGALNIGAVNDTFPQGQDAGFGTNYQATYVNGGLGGGVHANRIAHANRGCYHDFNWHRHFIARKNYFYNVDQGAAFAVEAQYGTYGQDDPPTASAYRIGKISAFSTSTVKVRLDALDADPAYLPGVVMQIVHTSAAHGIKTYNAVLMSVGWHKDGPDLYYEFEFRNPPGSNFVLEESVVCNLWFQQGLFLFEDNVIELALASVGYVTSGPIGIAPRGPYWVDGPLPPAHPHIINGVRGLEDGWIVHQCILRDNIIRKVGHRLDPLPLPAPNNQQTLSFGIRANSCEHLIVEGNIIGELNNPPLGPTRAPHELAFSNCRFYKSFNNQYSNGKLRPLFNDPSWFGNLQFTIAELESKIAPLI